MSALSDRVKTGVQMMDFLEFSRWHASSGDVDPVYPVLRAINERLGHDEEEAVGLTFLYVAFYNLPSALSAWLDGFRWDRPISDFPALLRLPCATERRAHRDPHKLFKHLASLHMMRDVHGGWRKWLSRSRGLARPYPAVAWEVLQGQLMEPFGNGRWAAYKTGEMLKSVHGWPVEPTDAGHAFSSGPRKGLGDLFPHLADVKGNDPQIIAMLDHWTSTLVHATGHPVEQVETHLCDWHSLVNGRYYIGHDIDEQLGQVMSCDRADVRGLVLVARGQSFDNVWRGELSERPGVRKHLNRLYVDEGVLRWWE